ncbi:MAG: saccharopine dehydrogenase, partial [Phycisphaera sp.]|nr:saccharopine dehydrogenase [Phycisphaera sp.]
MQPPGTDAPRIHDLLVWGATGYTGRLVAVAAAAHLGDRRWAIAGRSRVRLERIRDEIAETGTAPPDVVVADLEDAGSMRAMTGSTRVVLTTVGP